MSSSITLSAATRQNLLSLQDTAGLLSTTQNRLSTGKKVNSALDNPTNFFTSQSLSARSSDLSSLLDGMSNGVQVIQAANQGITSIQKLLDTAKSTAQQALADKSGGTSSTISGGHTALAASVTGGKAYGATSTDGTLDFSSLAKDGSIDVSLDGGATKTTLRLDASTLKSTTTDLTKVSKDQIISAINGQIAASSTLAGKVTATSTPDGKISLNTVGTGGDQQIKVAGSAGSSIDIGFGADTTTGGPTSASVIGTGGTWPNVSLTATAGAALRISDGSTTVTVKVDANTLKSDGTTLGSSATAANVADAINVQLKAAGSTVTADGTGQLRFTTQDKGPSAAVTVTGVAYDGTTAANNIDIGYGTNATGGTAFNGGALTAGTGTAATGVTAAGADATDGSSKATVSGSTIGSTKDFSTSGSDASFTLKLGDGVTKLISLTQSTVGSGSATTQASMAKSINDQIAADTGLNGKVVASFVNNQLTLKTTASGSDQKLTVKAAQTGNSQLDIGLGTASAGSAATSNSGTDVGGSKGVSSVRSALATQFNTILQQITQQAQDSNYNGVNLLYRTSNNSNDNTLHISFNEKDSSALNITGVKFDATGLGLSAAAGNFQSDDDINAAINQLTTATSTLRTQSSTFGSNLSVVQNRQDFTKNLNTILDTGSSNLTSADLNEEAANSQALSTRNSLAISALSLANQAQQGILQLLR